MDAPYNDVRMRLMRKGDTFEAWSCTNSPAYDEWYLVATHTRDYPTALNVGLVTSRWALQTGGPATLTNTFGNVVVRALVTATTNATGIGVNWIEDVPYTNGTLMSYSVNRAPINSDTFDELTTVASSVYAWNDTTAGFDTSYVYRVYAEIDEGAVTNDVLVGTSLPVRRQTILGNPGESSLKGFAAEYYDDNAGNILAGARVDPYIDDTWTVDDGTVYPPFTSDGLSDLDYLRVIWNGNFVADEPGCYGVRVNADDVFHLYVDDEHLLSQNNYQSGRWIYSAPIWLEAGRSHTFRGWMQENVGGQRAQVQWFKAGGTTTNFIPQSVIEPFPIAWQHRDLGDSPVLGNAVYDYTNQSFTVTAGRGGIDDQHLVWKKSSLDFDLIASAELANASEAGINAGLSIRSSDAREAQTVAVALTSDGAGGANRRIALAIRESDGTNVIMESSMAIPESVADLRLNRRGDNVLACYRTTTSGGWVIATNLPIDLPNEVWLGMYSYSANSLASNIFSDVTFVDTTPADLDASVSNLLVDVSTPGNPLLVSQSKTNSASIAWYWHPALSTLATGDDHPLAKSDHWANNFSIITNLNADNGYSANDTLSAPRTVAFYKLDGRYDFGAFTDGSTNDLPLTSALIGISDGSFNTDGQGLHTEFTREQNGFFPVSRPAHVQLRGLGGWEKGSGGGTPMVSAANSDDGAAIGPDHFTASWTGYLTPPYSGYYSFRTQMDDPRVLTVNGQVAAEKYNAGQIRYSPDIYLEAGVPVPIYSYFAQGAGGGYFRMAWKHGVGENAGYVGIPTTVLSPLAPQNSPFDYAPSSSNTFGVWQNIDINAAKPGHVIVKGSEDDFDCKIAGSGADVWGAADGFHYFYRECDAQHFEIKGTINAVIQADPWCKTGFMVRETTNSNSRQVNILQSANNGRHTQYRLNTGGGSADHDANTANAEFLNEGPGNADTPTRYKIKRWKNEIRFYLNDQLVPLDGVTEYYDISGWASDNVLVGLFITSHNNARLSEVMFNDVSFAIIPPKGSLLIVR